MNTTKRTTKNKALKAAHAAYDRTREAYDAASAAKDAALEAYDAASDAKDAAWEAHIAASEALSQFNLHLEGPRKKENRNEQRRHEKLPHPSH